ncbi:unnamed protein product [Brassica rapa subsp. narinosa]
MKSTRRKVYKKGARERQENKRKGEENTEIKINIGDELVILTTSSFFLHFLLSAFSSNTSINETCGSLNHYLLFD